MQQTPHFSTGMIHGYFKGGAPEEYWPVLALYMSIGAVSSIPWAYYHHPDLLNEMVQNISEIIKWFDNMQNPVPTWYLKDFPANEPT